MPNPFNPYEAESSEPTQEDLDLIIAGLEYEIDLIRS